MPIEKVSMEELTSATGREFTNTDDLREFLNKREEIKPDTMTSLGAGFSLNDVNIPSPTAGIIPMLDSINSPLVDLSGEREISRRDFVNAVYIIVKGRAALDDIFGMVYRREQLNKLKKYVDMSPEYFRIFIDKHDEINQAMRRFEDAAMAFAEQFTVAQWSEVELVIEQYFMDIYTSMSRYEGADSGGDDKKKGSTPNG